VAVVEVGRALLGRGEGPRVGPREGPREVGIEVQPVWAACGKSISVQGNCTKHDHTCSTLVHWNFQPL